MPSCFSLESREEMAQEFLGFDPQTFEFFMAIGFNNTKECYEDWKEVFQEHVLEPMRRIVRDLAPMMLEIDPQFDTRPRMGGAISRIRRDTRFSRDKSPYRQHMWLEFKQRTEVNKMGFWLDIGAQGAEYGMGIYEAETKDMHRMRRHIVASPNKFLKLTKGLEDFTLGGELYRRPPVLCEDERIAPFIHRKVFQYHKDLTAKQVMEPGLIDQLRDGYQRLAPLYQFLRAQL